MVITFASEKALEYLLEHGHVYTFRLKRRVMLGRDWMNDHRLGKKISDVYVEELLCLSFSDLGPYVTESGFKTLKGWIDEAVVLNWKPKGTVINGETVGWLYLVTLR